MKLLYTTTLNSGSPGSIIIPFGVKKMKINSTAGVESNELGKLTTSGFSLIQSYSFPIIDGSSPNVFTFKAPSERLVVSVFVEEVGGTPDPDYFTREANTSE